MSEWQLCVIDVNINRACEGIRAIEEIAKFRDLDKDRAAALRAIRHRIRGLTPSGIGRHRLRVNDLGYVISVSQGHLGTKVDAEGLVLANEARVAEALRVIEEVSYVAFGHELARKYEAIRHDFYRLTYQLSRPRLEGLYPLVSGSEDDFKNLEAFRAMGVMWIQYRDKSGVIGRRYERASRLRACTRDLGMHMIVNDDVALALAVEADGVHLGQDDLMPEVARRLAPNLVIGVSTHTLEQLAAANHMPVDYIAFGPVFKTLSKEAHEPAVGIEQLRLAARVCKKPLVAIGGIGAHHLKTLKDIGVDAVAAISALASPEGVRACSNIWNQRGDRG